MQKGVDAGTVRRAAAIAVIALGGFAADIVTKMLAKGGVFGRGSFWFVGITEHHNTGLLANAPVPWSMILATNAVATVALIVLLYRSRNRWHEACALALALGGALGNALDRVRLGHVYDWIILFDTSIINLADVCIAVGVGMYLLVHYREGRDEATKR